MGEMRPDDNPNTPDVEAGRGWGGQVQSQPELQGRLRYKIHVKIIKKKIPFLKKNHSSIYKRKYREFMDRENQDSLFSWSPCASNQSWGK